jgi:hypothetical protein
MLKGECGLLGAAYDAARYAMDLHRWTRYWAAQMRLATNPIDLWRHSVLLWKIVDGRFSGEEVVGDTPGPLIQRFGATLKRANPYQDQVMEEQTSFEAVWNGFSPSSLCSGSIERLI